MGKSIRVFKSFQTVVTRMDTSKSGWTPYVYYTTLYSTPRYTIFRRIYWARELLEKWGNQRETIEQEKELNTVFSTEVQ